MTESPDRAADAVRADLRLLAAATPPMPAELITRLDLALAAEIATPSAPPSTSPSPGFDAHAARPVRRRWPRLVVAVTTGVMVLAGLTVGATALWRGQQQESAGDSAAAPESRRESPAPTSAVKDGSEGLNGGPGETEVRVLHSGRDYSETTLPELGMSSSLAEKSSDPALDRLSTSPTARQDCFTAVIGKYPGQITLADFGYFKGTPALVVRVTSDGAERFVAVGADCGAVGAGADELYTVAA